MAALRSRVPLYQVPFLKFFAHMLLGSVGSGNDACESQASLLSACTFEACGIALGIAHVVERARKSFSMALMACTGDALGTYLQ